MRLCFISNPNLVHTRRWVSWFARHGHTVCLLADVPRKDSWCEVPVIDLTRIFSARYIRFPIWSAWLTKFLSSWHPHVLHAHRVNSAGWIAAASGFHPFVVTPWGTDLNDLVRQPRIAHPLAKYVLKRADLITADSEDLLSTARRLGAKHEICHLIRWGVDLQTFSPGDPTELHKQLDISGGPILLSIRALGANYNIHIIIDAFATVLVQYPQAVLVLRDYNATPSYKAQLLQKITELKLDQSVRWLGDISSREIIAEAYRMADVAISIPTTDSMAVSIWEALACGIPIIASDVPSLREVIRSGENGILVPIGKADSLAQAIVDLLADKDMQNRFRQKGIILARQNADHEKEMAKMEQLYQSLISSRIN